MFDHNEPCFLGAVSVCMNHVMVDDVCAMLSVSWQVRAGLREPDAGGASLPEDGVLLDRPAGH